MKLLPHGILLDAVRVATVLITHAKKCCFSFPVCISFVVNANPLSANGSVTHADVLAANEAAVYTQRRVNAALVCLRSSIGIMCNTCSWNPVLGLKSFLKAASHLR